MSDKGGRPELRIALIGAFRVLAPDGEDLTPRGRKARALLAILALTPTRRRSRPALQDKLWSDRGPEQGAASLRALEPTLLSRHSGSAARPWVRLLPPLTVTSESGFFLSRLVADRIAQGLVDQWAIDVGDDGKGPQGLQLRVEALPISRDVT